MRTILRQKTELNNLLSPIIKEGTGMTDDFKGIALRDKVYKIQIYIETVTVTRTFRLVNEMSFLNVFPGFIVSELCN